MEARQGEIIILGTLQNVLSPRNPELWKGSISREKRLLPAGDLSGKEAFVQSIEAQVNDFYVMTTFGVSKRCVDGRSPEPTLPSYGQRRLLGPQVQGGTTAEIIAYRYVKGAEGATTLAADTVRYIQNHRSNYAPGNHIGNPQQCTPGHTGCGNLDSQQERAQWYANGTVATAVQAGVGAIMQAGGKSATSGAYEIMMHNAEALRSVVPEYYAQLDEVVAAIQEAENGSIETLPGAHNELRAMINFVSGTTFDRDAFNALSDSAVQMFGLDGWNVIEEHPAEVAQAIFSDTITTLMKLTDGTLELGFRKPAEAASIAP